MKKKSELSIILLTAYLTGCVSTGEYFVDRWRDATDIVTIAVEEKSVGTTAQIGPLIAGVSYGDGRGFGLRSGCMGSYEFIEITYLLGGRKQFIGNDERDGKAYDIESSLLAVPFEIVGVVFIMAPLSWLDDELSCSILNELWQDHPPILCEEGGWQTYFQCEASLSLYGGIRAGVNPAEAIDFIVGWTTLDICGDDRKDVETGIIIE